MAAGWLAACYGDDISPWRWKVPLPPLPAAGEAGSGLTVAQSRWGEDGAAVGRAGAASGGQEAQEGAEGAELRHAGAWNRRAPAQPGQSPAPAASGARARQRPRGSSAKPSPGARGFHGSTRRLSLGTPLRATAAAWLLKSARGLRPV